MAARAVSARSQVLLEQIGCQAFTSGFGTSGLIQRYLLSAKLHRDYTTAITTLQSSFISRKHQRAAVCYCHHGGRRRSVLSHHNLHRYRSSCCSSSGLSQHPVSLDGLGHSCQPHRTFMSTQEGKNTSIKSSPDYFYALVEAEMSSLFHGIRQRLGTTEPVLLTMSHYFFDGKGKTFRPLVALLMAKACNCHSDIGPSILWSQEIVAMVAEMIHTASLVHDDVIDASDTRRGQSSLNKLYGQRRSILTGDYILAQASITLSHTGNEQVISVLSNVLADLVSGEFMQLGSKEDENERFSHYLKKTYKKTASLIANTCKAVAILSGCDEESSAMAFQYGKNLGIAFQLVDDVLDFVSNELVMGKPTAADLKLGLATAPVLFAAQEYPELHPMIMRRFSKAGDVEYARNLVAKSDGMEQARLLASKYSQEAIKNIQNITASDAQRALVQLANILLERKK